ncbi:endonuclease domain-containing protein [Sphingomonas sp. MA1305]|uniref:endonuclease domain-containing protein n=1 Tax=Sphingomonas sp. MA1305 TaxID=2479204 RepID=UPI0018DF0A12|nr:endonuclease domain-containing protein [Sphingomonas sp. MA1305]
MRRLDGEERVGGVTGPANPPRHGEGDRRAQRDGGGGSPQSLRPETALARQLRRDMSLPEVLLWQRLKGQQAGIKFRKQHPVGSYVADFYCSATRTIVEVDGETHNRGSRPAHDAQRDAFLIGNGYRILHVSATEVLRDVDAAAEAVAAFAASPLHHQPAAGGPPPRAGED